MKIGPHLPKLLSNIKGLAFLRRSVLTKGAVHYLAGVSRRGLSQGIFLPHDAMHKRGLCRHAVSVCLSVTFVDCVKRNKHIIKIF